MINDWEKSKDMIKSSK